MCEVADTPTGVVMMRIQGIRAEQFVSGNYMKGEIHGKSKES